MIYDYYPDMQVVFTGSSILEIYKGNADLSRRVLSYFLPGLSFREYLILAKGIKMPPLSLSEILSHKVDFSSNERPLKLFKEYLVKGFYPFFAEPGYEIKLRQILNTTIENDIPAYAQMNVATTKKLKQLLYIIAQSVPFKPNYTKIGQMIDVHRNQVADFLFYLERAGIVSQLRNGTGGIRMLGKVEKTYLDNTNLAYALSDSQPDMGNVRETFFMSQMRVQNLIVASNSSDLEIGKYTFEIGGINKQQKRIRGIDEAYVVKDDIEYGYGNVIPLWQFGFNY